MRASNAIVTYGDTASGRPSIVACHPGTEDTRSRSTWVEEEFVTIRTFEGVGHWTGTGVPRASIVGQPADEFEGTSVAVAECGIRYRSSLPTRRTKALPDGPGAPDFSRTYEMPYRRATAALSMAGIK